MLLVAGYGVCLPIGCLSSKDGQWRKSWAYLGPRWPRHQSLEPLPPQNRIDWFWENTPVHFYSVAYAVIDWIPQESLSLSRWHPTPRPLTTWRPSSTRPGTSAWRTKTSLSRAQARFSSGWTGETLRTRPIWHVPTFQRRYLRLRCPLLDSWGHRRLHCQGPHGARTRSESRHCQGHDDFLPLSSRLRVLWRVWARVWPMLGWGTGWR